MASRFELFLKYRVVFTPVCPPLQDASKQSSSTAAEWINYKCILLVSLWGIRDTRRTADILSGRRMNLVLKLLVD